MEGLFRKLSEAIGKLVRTLNLVVKSLFTVLTRGKYYICYECGEIHKRQPDDIDIFAGGFFSGKVFASNVCAGRVIARAQALLRKEMLKDDQEKL